MMMKARRCSCIPGPSMIPRKWVMGIEARIISNTHDFQIEGE